jgi:2-succinyl-5-enolpyruvyl-6-hydroxy-3-cyclohexene-1-carboxylate synthase
VTSGDRSAGYPLPSRAENPSRALALVLVDELVRLGMTDACLAPGSRSAPLAMALAEHPGVRLHVVIDERSASFLALGLAKGSGRPAAVVSTSGTAAANFHPAVVEADHSGTPLLVLTADRPPELRQTGANQTIDQVKIYGSSVRWFAEAGVPEARPGAVAYWRSLACRAWAAACGPGRGAGGPVHLNLAFRDPLVPLPEGDGFPYELVGRPDGRPWTEVRSSTHPLREQDLEWLVAEISSTERGLVVAGDGWTDPAPVVALAQAAGWPLVAEAISGARTGSNAISAYDALLRHAPFAEAHRPDLVLRIGRTGLSKGLSGLLGPGVRQVLLDPSPRWPDPDRSTTVVVEADPATACADLAKALPYREPTAWPDLARAEWLREPSSWTATSERFSVEAVTRQSSRWLTSWLDAERLAREALDRVLDELGGDGRPTEPRIARDLVAGLPAGATLVAGSSMPVRDLDWFMAPRAGLRILGNRGASGIDGFISTVLGIALAGGSRGGRAAADHGDRPEAGRVGPQGGRTGEASLGRGPVVALAGDLSMLHDQNGLLLAGRDRLDAVFVVVNNDGGGIFSFLPQARFPEHFERLFGTPHGVDFEAFAALHRCGYERVDRASDLIPAVTRATEAGGVRLVEVQTDRRANVAHHQQAWDAVAEALRSL